MNCRHIRRMIPNLLDNELPPEAVERIRAHLDRCPQCRDLSEAFQRDQEMLHTFLRAAPWLPVADRVRAQLPMHSRRARWQQRATRAYRLTARIALVALLLFIGAVAAVIRNTAQNHRQSASTSMALNAAALVTPITATDSQQTFSNVDLNVSLRFPMGWRQRYNSDIISFESTNAQNRLGYYFLSLSGLDGASLDAICQSNAAESHHTYGLTPRIEHWAVQGQPACLIFPSADQQDPHGGFAALIVQAPQPFRFPASSAHAYLSLRVDMLHFRAVAQTVRFLQFPVAKANAIWNTVALDTRGLLQAWEPGMAPGELTTVQGAQGIVNGQHNSYQVDYDGPGKRLSIGIGPFTPPTGASQQMTVRGLQATLITTPDGHLTLWWVEHGNDAPIARDYYRSFITAEGISAADVQTMADSLRPMQQPIAPQPLSHELPGTQSFENPGLGDALYTAKEFMEARIARDPQQAFGYLNGDTRTIVYGDLLPPDATQWIWYTIINARRESDSTISVTVQITEQEGMPPVSHLREQTLRVAGRGKIIGLGQLLNSPSQRSTGWIPYTNPLFNVTFPYPAQWQKKESNAVMPERYEGADGYFDIELARVSDPACPSPSTLDTTRYGDRPVIELSRIEGQETCLIRPSADASGTSPADATLMVPEPQPVTFRSGTYNLLVLHGDVVHLRSIAQSLRFLTVPVTQEESIWNGVRDGVKQSVSPVLRPGALPPELRQVEARNIGPGAFEVVYSQYSDSGKRLQIGVYPYQLPPPDPGGTRAQVTVRGQPATLQVNDPKDDGRIWLSWEEPGNWQPSGEKAARNTVFYLIYAEGLTAEEVQHIAASLAVMGG